MNDLTNITTVSQLCAAFREAEETTRRCFAELVEAQSKLNASFLRHAYDPSGPTSDLIIINPNDCHHSADFDKVERTITQMRRGAWRVISERLEITRIMSVQRRKEHDEWLDRGPMPPLTEKEVEAFVRRFVEDMRVMFETAVKEVFDWLRPRGYTARELKTNQKNATFELGSKIILPWTVNAGWGLQAWSLQYDDRAKFIALENVFSILDGRGAVSKTYNGELCDAIAKSASGVGETTWFRFRCCKNRNLHIEFRRMDLVAKLNQIAGGANLKPEAA